MTTILGGNPPAPEPAAPSRQQTDVERDLYGEAPPAGVPSREMYPVETALREVFRNRVDEVSDVLGLTQAQRHIRHREFVALVRETGINPEQVGGVLYNAITDAQMAEARGTSADVDRQVRVEDTRSVLREMYGSDEAEALVKRTETFVQAHPALRTMLSTGGIGANSKVVLALVDHVRTQNIR